jgi:hypothetical protein
LSRRESDELVFALTTLCGFDVPSIAQRLFMTEVDAYKRLAEPELGCVRRNR